MLNNVQLANAALLGARIAVITKPDAPSACGSKTNWRFGTRIGVHKSDKRNYKLDLIVSFEQFTPDFGNHGFEGDVHVVGVLQLDTSIPEGQMEEAARIQGTELLYNTLRGMLLQITSTFNTGGPLMLPSLSAQKILGWPTGDEPKKKQRFHQAKDDSQKAAELVRAVAATKKRKGTELLASPKRREQFAEAPKKEKARARNRKK